MSRIWWISTKFELGPNWANTSVMSFWWAPFQEFRICKFFHNSSWINRWNVPFTTCPYFVCMSHGFNISFYSCFYVHTRFQSNFFFVFIRYLLAWRYYDDGDNYSKQFSQIILALVLIERKFRLQATRAIWNISLSGQRFQELLFRYVVLFLIDCWYLVLVSWHSSNRK